LPSLSHFVSDVRGTIDAADVSLSELSDVTLRLEQGTRDAAVAIDGAGRMVAGDVASSLEAVETALPGLIEAASVIDGTLQTLSVFGVGYDPAVPFDDALADLEAGFDGLPARVRLQGEDLSSLAPIVATSADDTAGVRTSIDGLRTQLGGLSQSLGAVEPTINTLGTAVDAAAGFGRWAWLARVLIVVGAFAGVGLAASLWVAADTVRRLAAVEETRDDVR
jgi:hypothetical protein